MSVQPVVEVGVIPEDLEDVEAAVAEVAELTGADAEAFQASIDAADPGNFVPAITLRQEEFDAIEQELNAIPGTEFGERELPLAPTREFARVLLGAVGPATEEQIAESDGAVDIDDQVGQGGLQAAFEEQLAGTPERSVVIRNDAGEPVETLQTVEGEPGEALETTLDLEVQGAAERALEPSRTAVPRWSRSSLRPVTSSRSRTGPPTRRSTGRWPGSTRRDRPSR